MRYYVTRSEATWWTIAPQVPGVASEDAPSRDTAIERCRDLVATEIDAYARLGQALDVDPSEEILDWTLPWWLIPDQLVPTPPSLLAAALLRMDEIAAEVDGFIDALAPEDWDRGPSEGWAVRRVLDHVAGGFEIGIRRLRPWALDPQRAQRQALDELLTRITTAPQRRVEQIGMNRESGRVTWTPRKVARAVAALQDAMRAHLEAGGPPPLGVVDHRDAADDEAPASDEQLRALAEGDAALERLAAKDRSARGIAMSYRYYADRLTPWPNDVRERWRAMRAAYKERLLALDETQLALVRVAPSGQLTTVRLELGLGLSHVREHLAQMRAALEAR